MTNRAVPAPLTPVRAGASGLLAQFEHPRGLLGAIAGHVMAIANTPANAWLVHELDIAADDRVLEVGFGPGVGIHLAARAASRGRVIGVDHSETMLAQARRRNARAIARGHVDLRLGSGYALPLENASVDKAFSVNVAQFYGDLEGGLNEVFRVLAPGGKAAIGVQAHDILATSQWCWSHRLFSAMRSVGFVDIVETCGGARSMPIAATIAKRPN